MIIIEESHDFIFGDADNALCAEANGACNNGCDDGCNGVCNDGCNNGCNGNCT